MSDNLSSASIQAANAKPAVTTPVAKSISTVDSIPNWAVKEVEALEVDLDNAYKTHKALVVIAGLAFIAGFVTHVVIGAIF